MNIPIDIQSGRLISLILLALRAGGGCGALWTMWIRRQIRGTCSPATA